MNTNDHHAIDALKLGPKTQEYLLRHTALVIAVTAHAGKTRKDGITPAVKHSMLVAERFFKDDTDAYVTALLHDVVEDSNVDLTTLDMLGIPKHIIAAVDKLTHWDHAPYLDYIAAIKTNPLATKVKIADIENNLSDSPSARKFDLYHTALDILKDPISSASWEKPAK